MFFLFEENGDLLRMNLVLLCFGGMYPLDSCSLGKMYLVGTEIYTQIVVQVDSMRK